MLQLHFVLALLHFLHWSFVLMHARLSGERMFTVGIWCSRDRQHLCSQRLLSVFSSANKSESEERKVSSLISHSNSNIWEHVCCHTHPKRAAPFPSVSLTSMPERIQIETLPSAASFPKGYPELEHERILVLNSAGEVLDGRWLALSITVTSLSSPRWGCLFQAQRVCNAELQPQLTKADKWTPAGIFPQLYYWVTGKTPRALLKNNICLPKWHQPALNEY